MHKHVMMATISNMMDAQVIVQHNKKDGIVKYYQEVENLNANILNQSSCKNYQSRRQFMITKLLF
jgi:hypothetical protein